MEMTDKYGTGNYLVSQVMKVNVGYGKRNIRSLQPVI